MSDSAQLLHTYQPYLKYDSQEAYFADAAGIFVVSPGMRLRHKGKSIDIAVAGAALSLALLAHDPYSGTQERWSETDTIGARTSSTASVPRPSTRTPATPTAATATS